MDSIVSVEREVNKVIEKFASIQKKIEPYLDNLVFSVENFQRDFIKSSPSHEYVLSGSQETRLNDIIKKVRAILKEIAIAHKEIHGCVSKVGKAIDKNFAFNFSHLLSESFNERSLDNNLLNQVIIEHFLRQGMMDISQELMREGRVNVPPEKTNPFAQLNRVLDGLKKHNVQPALEWVEANKEALRERNSVLEFKLHRLQFIEYLSQGLMKQQELLEYARKYFPSLAARHEKEMQALMGCLVYWKSGIENSPYQHLLDPVNWSEICDIFTRDACALLGLSVDSPLSVTFDAGAIALPALMNLRAIMMQTSVPSIWSTKDELPILIDVGRNCQFHSIFACPILRQQSTDFNPPMRLVCGHVVSKDALNKLASTNKLKCPYCPVEQNPQEARQIQF
ncbi:E3 ubiquitin-protein ligase RMND5A-like [Brevipalpus obovatus]|uniref:E3 ubiquitin-protein ligase RMND5A-like n=1 Tax=Brevipalpus obovatus TaxID=246614 RepID=UPI003D9E8999